MFTNMSFVICVCKKKKNPHHKCPGSCIKLPTNQRGVGDPHRSGLDVCRLCQPPTAVNNFDVFSSMKRRFSAQLYIGRGDAFKDRLVDRRHNESLI